MFGEVDNITYNLHALDPLTLASSGKLSLNAQIRIHLS
jgi:hypothetical protein